MSFSIPLDSATETMVLKDKQMYGTIVALEPASNRQ